MKFEIHMTGFKLMDRFLGHLCVKNPDEKIRLTFAIRTIHVMAKIANYHMRVSTSVIY